MVVFTPYDTPSAPLVVEPSIDEVNAARVTPEPHRMPQCGRHELPVEGCGRCETVAVARAVLRDEALARHRRRRHAQGRFGR